MNTSKTSNNRTGLAATTADVFSFPNPVNEIAARGVAAMVVALTLATIFADQWWLLAILVYGFAARVTTGPTLSPLGLISTRVLVPLLGNPSRPTPGPPKQFAQAVGLAFSVTALVLFLLVDSSVPYRAVLGVLAGFAFLESGVGFCAGCFVFGWLMKWGVIPASICEECLLYEPAAA
jgi:hypothetical protein